MCAPQHFVSTVQNPPSLRTWVLFTFVKATLMLNVLKLNKINQMRTWISKCRDLKVLTS